MEGLLLAPRAGHMAEDNRINPRTLVAAGLWGGVTVLTAYLLSFGSLPLFVVLLVVFGVLFRVVARAVMKRKGVERPRGWWL